MGVLADGTIAFTRRLADIGEQVFTMAPDGSCLRQEPRGMVNGADGNYLREVSLGGDPDWSRSD